MPTVDPQGNPAPQGGFQNGGWYSGHQYFNGSFAAPGMFHAASGQTGAAPVQNAADAAYLAKLGDTTAPNRVVNQPSTNPAPASSGSSSGGGLSLPQAPTFDLVAATNAAYNTPEIAAAQKAITDRQTALAKASADINDNPFYSEATRVGKQERLTNEANADIGVQQNILAGLKADAAIKLNAAAGQYNINRQSYQDTLSQFSMILQAGGLTNASPSDLATMSVQTGIPISELQSIQKTQQQKDISTSLITGDNGSISIINSKTGEIISQTQPGVGVTKGAAGGSGAGGFSKSQITSAISYLKQQDAANYGTSDHQLSDAEIKAAYSQILALVGGDETRAQALLDQAQQQGGYSQWTPTASPKSNGSIPVITGIENWWNSL